MKKMFLTFAVLLSISNFAHAEVFEKVRYLGGYPGVKNKEVKGDLEITQTDVIFWQGKKKKNKALFRIRTADLLNVTSGKREYTHVDKVYNPEYKDVVIHTPGRPDRVVSTTTQHAQLVVSKRYYDVVTFGFRDSYRQSAGAPVFQVKRDSALAIRMVAEQKTGRNFEPRLAYDGPAMPQYRGGHAPRR